MSSLKSLDIRFRPSESHPACQSRSIPPQRRSILPGLLFFEFKGVTEFIELLVTFIDAPRLETLDVTFFDDQINFDCPRLAQFIDRAPNIRACDDGHVRFNDDTAIVNLQYRTYMYYNTARDPEIKISCSGTDRQLSSTLRLCKSFFHALSTIEDLHIDNLYSRDYQTDDAIALWLQLLLPFTGVKKLYISERFGPSIAAAMQELVGERTREVLPNLQYMSIWCNPLGRFRENIAQFLTARRLSGQPVTISVRNKDVGTWYEGDEEEKSALSCMYSDLISIEREADVVVCAQRRNCARNRRGLFIFFGPY